MHRFQRNNGPNIKDFAIRLSIRFTSLAAGYHNAEDGRTNWQQLGQEERRAFNSTVVSCHSRSESTPYRTCIIDCGTCFNDMAACVSLRGSRVSGRRDILCAHVVTPYLIAMFLEIHIPVMLAKPGRIWGPLRCHVSARLTLTTPYRRMMTGIR